MCPRSKKLAKKLFTQASGNLVNRISNSNMSTSRSTLFSECPNTGGRDLSQNKWVEDLQDTQYRTSFSSMEELFSKHMKPNLDLYAYLLE